MVSVLDDLVVGEKQSVQGTGTVVGYVVNPVVKDNKSFDKLSLQVQFAGDSNIHNISTASYIWNNKVKTSALWVKLDRDGNIAFNSSLACTLRGLSVATLKSLVGRQVVVVQDDKGYACIKAY